MLEELYIKDFALIRELKVSFGPGLNIITGETGAGKSIVLGALSLVLGSKATTDMIRSGCKRSVVEAVFLLAAVKNESGIMSELENLGIELEEKTLILKREINSDGRGRSFVNSRQVPAQVLRQLGKELVDIHGQHEHQNILQIDTHRMILDRYAQLGDDVAKISVMYKTHADYVQKLKSVSLNEKDKERRLEVLRHEIDEIEKANLERDNELDELIAEESALANAETIIRDYSAIYEALQDSEGGIMQRLNILQNLLEKNIQFDPDLETIAESMREAFYQLEDVASQLRSKAENISIDPEKTEMVRERIDLIQGLLRKYGRSVAAVKEYFENARNELTGIELSSEQEAKLKQEIATLEQKMCQLAEQISVKRRAAAVKLEEQVKQQLADLGMPSTLLRLSVKWAVADDGVYQHEQKRYIIYSTGLDIIEMLIAANGDDTLRPLRKIASGGEMSRIMLSLKKIIIDSDPVETMIFDEVDAGIGGGVAEMVGKKLASLSLKSQVIVITHSHQIAAMSPPDIIHLKVEKNSDEGTAIRALSHKQRTEEIARMIGGTQITTSAMDHARSLIGARHVF